MFFSLASYCELGNGTLRGAPTAFFFRLSGVSLVSQVPRKACRQLGYLGDTYAKYSIEPASSFSLNSLLLNVSENLTPNCLPLFSHQSFPLLVEIKQVAYRVMEVKT